MVLFELKNFFWPARTRKILTFCWYIKSLAPGVQMLHRHIWSKMDILIFFIVLANIVGKVFPMIFFHLWVQFCVEVFSFWTFTETFEILNSKNGSNTNWMILSIFCSNMPRFFVVTTTGTKKRRNGSNVVRFWRHEFFLIFVCGIFCSVLQMWRYFSYVFLKASLEFYQCNAALLPFCSSTASSFLANSDRVAYWYLWKRIRPISIFFKR